MIYKIAICDDNKTDIEYVASLVKNWAYLTNNTVNIDVFSSAEAFLFKYEDDKSYNILLLDIEMGKMNGVELAKKVRAGNREVQMIFISGYSEYIADGYDVEALNYILKPVSSEKLIEVLNRACEKIKKNEDALIFNLPDSVVRIPLYEIRYVEVQANYVTIHGVQEITVKTTLSKVEEKLDNEFFRVGRSFIVNMHYIRKITKKEVILDGNISIPLSRGFYEPLNRAFINTY